MFSQLITSMGVKIISADGYHYTLKDKDNKVIFNGSIKEVKSFLYGIEYGRGYEK